MKNSLTLKMFITILISFIFIIVFITSSIYIYFNFFYEDIVINRVIDNINTFSHSYTKENWSDDELVQNINKFNNENNVYLDVFLPEQGLLSTSSSFAQDINTTYFDDSEMIYYITLTKSDNYYNISLNDNEYQLLQNEGLLEINHVIFIDGYIDDYGTILPKKINHVTMDSFVDVSNSIPLLQEDEVQSDFIISGIDSYTYIDNYSDAYSEDYAPYDAISSEDIDYFYETYEKKEITYTITQLPYTNYRQVSFQKFIAINDSQAELYANISLQSVAEIMESLKASAPYFILVSFLLAFVIALIYSKSVSRPIVALTKTANAMAGMDLDIRSNINRQDELGLLSASLNTLAENLDASMRELVYKNQQLEEDVQLKIRQEESRKAFVANASHELKTPLGIIKSYFEALQDGVKVEKKDYYTLVIMNEIENMNRLIQEMLTLSKLDASENKLKLEDIDVEPLVTNILKHNQQSLDSRQLSFNIKTPLHPLFGDKEKINQVLINLIGNAIKYADSSSTITMETIQKNKQTGLYIYNDCPSFSDESLEKVWERFYKIDTSHNKFIEGNGLGLSIVKSILEAHSATYGVYNTLKGVCFYFIL